MWLTLLNNWKLLAYSLSALLLLAMSWQIQNWKAKADQLDAKNTELSKCYGDQKLTQELSLDYQKKISAVEYRLANAKRLRSEVCLPISNSPSSIIRTDTAKLPNANGISSWALIDYAADAQKVNERAALCKDFLEKFSK